MATRIKLKTWRPETVDQLKQYWVTGTSVAEIANEMRISRNAIIGKAHRLKLGEHPYNNKNPGIRAQRHKGPRETFDPNELVHMIDLRTDECRWPVGDPNCIDFGFCGATRTKHGAYCKQHREVAFR